MPHAKPTRAFTVEEQAEATAIGRAGAKGRLTTEQVRRALALQKTNRIEWEDLSTRGRIVGIAARQKDTAS